MRITETSTTLSRPRSTRKFVLLPLFLSPRLTGEVAGPLAPSIGLSRGERLISPHPAVKLPHARLVLGLLPLPPPLLLFLLLLQLQVLAQEGRDGGGVHFVAASQRRHHQERCFPRGAPHGAVTPLRPGVKETARPPPREWRLLRRRAARAPLPPRPWPSSVPSGRWCVNSARVIAKGPQCLLGPWPIPG